MTISEIVALCKWGPPKNNGGRYVTRYAFSNPEFDDLWRSRKPLLRSLGLVVGKSNGRTVVRWRMDEQDWIESLRQSIPVPDGKEFFPFQLAGIAKMLEWPDVLNADDTGLGKTIQVIGLANADPALNKVLIVCPASVKLNWAREWERWATRIQSINVVFSDAGGRFSSDVVIINYDIVDRFLDEIHRIEWDLIVYDEAHYLKNTKAKRTKYLLGGAISWQDSEGVRRRTIYPPLKASRRVFLTATPLLNGRPIELWPILRTIDPAGLGSSYPRYTQRYCAVKTRKVWIRKPRKPGGPRFRRITDRSGADNLEELQQKLRSKLMIRRLKEDVLDDLPPKRHQMIEFPLTRSLKSLVDEEMQVYDNYEEYLKTKGRAASESTYLFARLSEIRKEVALSKVPFVIDFLRDALEAGRVVCFAHHREVLQRIYEAFKDDLDVGLIIGGKSTQQKQEVIDRAANNKCQFVLVSIHAGGVGINLQMIPHLVFAEFDWTPGVMEQAEDRCDRIGRTQPLLIQDLVLENSLDARLLKARVEKQKVIDKAINE